MSLRLKHLAFALLGAHLAGAASDAPAHIDEWTGDLPLPYARRGFGVLRNQYVNGRISCYVSRNGQIGRLSFHGGQGIGAHEIFATDENGVFGKLFRVQVFVDETPYRLTFEKTTHHPYGYTSECTVAGVRFGHEFVLDDNVVFQRVRVLSNPQGKKVRARGIMSGFSWKARANRTHGDFRLEAAKGRFTAEFRDVLKTGEGGAADEAVTIPVSMGLFGRPAVYPLQDGRYLKGDKKKDADFWRFQQKRKFYVEARDAGDDFVYYLVFAERPGEDLSGARIDRVHARFADVYATCATFETGDRATDSALGCVVPVMAAHEAGRPGAYRASPVYWTWGWDAMVHADAFALAGQPAGVRRMLDFLRETAHPEGGIMHAYNYGFAGTVKERLAPPTQPFYALLLLNYFSLTGDAATRDRCLPLARLVVDRALEMRRPGEALVRWYDMFPDNPFCLGQTDNDFSAFDNSIFYQGVRALAELTGERRYLDEAARIREAFERLLWDEDAGYFYNWADGETKKGVAIHQAFNVLYISPWAFDLKGGEIGRIASFMKNNFLANYGIRNLHWRSPAFMQDGVQQGEYFPVTERYYWNVMNRARDVASLQDFRRIHGSYWKILTYPEGQTLEVENADILDYYEDTPGMKQIFTAKAWLASALELWLGLEIGTDGLRFRPMNDGLPFAVRGLAVRGRRLNVTMKGAGTAATLVFNGKPCDGFLPYAAFDRAVNTLEIQVR